MNVGTTAITGILAATALGCGGGTTTAHVDASSDAREADEIVAIAPQGSDLFLDGRRLVSHVLSFPGTDPFLLGVRDLATGQDCSFAALSDGTFRCTSTGQPGAGVPGRLVRVRRGARLAVDQIATDDGGRFPAAGSTDRILDTRWMQACKIGGVTATTASCWPSMAVAGIFYGDPACSLPLAYGSSGPAPVFAVQGDVMYFALGQRWTGPMFAKGTPGCQMISSTPMAPAYTLGARLPDDSVAAVRVVPRGVGRLVRHAVFEGDQFLTMTRIGGPFFDVQAAHDCGPVRTPRTGVRCISGVDLRDPTSRPEGYADPACSTVAVESPPEATMVAYLGPGSRTIDPLPQVTTLHELGPPMPMRFVKEGAACTRQLALVRWSARSPEIAWDRFPPLEESFGTPLRP